LPFGTPGTTSWNRGEGWMTALAVDPANSRIVYSGADAVRKSTDGAHSWKTVFVPHAPSGVPALAIAPTRPEAIYAITNASNGRTSHTSIYKSTDAGKTWHASGPGSVFTNPGGWGYVLAVDPQHPRANCRKHLTNQGLAAAPPAALCGRHGLIRSCS
jgi:hypothetical protein